MDDLIGRQAAIDAIEFGITYAKAINKETGEVKELFQEGNKELKKAVERVKALLFEQPKIIICRNCKYYKLGSDGVRYCFKHDDDILWEDDDFCSRAERRTDE